MDHAPATPLSARTAIVILNYRTVRQTIAAVRSVQSSPSRDVIVVDNASNDGSVAMMERELPGVDLIASPVNGGFSAGCNLGIARALSTGAARVLLLNSDATIDDSSLAALEGALSTGSRLGIVAPIIVDASNPDRVESAGIGYSRRTGRMRHRSFGQSRTRLSPRDYDAIDGVSGCAMMVRRDVFERIGVLAEDYFFGFEDLDFCLRARAAGFEIGCVGASVARHEGSLSIGKGSALRIYYATRNHLLVGERFGAPPALAWLRIASVLGLNFAGALMAPQVPTRRSLAGFVHGIRDYFAGRYGRARPEIAAKLA